MPPFKVSCCFWRLHILPCQLVDASGLDMWLPDEDFRWLSALYKSIAWSICPYFSIRFRKLCHPTHFFVDFICPLSCLKRIWKSLQRHCVFQFVVFALLQERGGCVYRVLMHRNVAHDSGATKKTICKMTVGRKKAVFRSLKWSIAFTVIAIRSVNRTGEKNAELNGTNACHDSAQVAAVW